MQTEPSTGNGKGRRRSKARQDKSGQEAVKDVTALNDAMQKLVNLHNAFTAAKEDLSEGIKKAAEKSGYLAPVVRRLVTAKAGDKFDEVKRIVDQLGEVFELQ